MIAAAKRNLEPFGDRAVEFDYRSRRQRVGRIADELSAGALRALELFLGSAGKVRPAPSRLASPTRVRA